MASTVLAIAALRGAIADAASTSLVLRVSPSNFVNFKFELNDGTRRVVTPGFLIGLHTGAPRGIYELSLVSPALANDYVLTISVSGPNVRIFHQGGPYTSENPKFRLTDVGDSLEPAVVTVSLRRGHSPTTTTTVSTTSTTTTTVGTS
jgi:hypothetical protein